MAVANTLKLYIKLFCFLSDLHLQGFVHALSAVKTLIKYKPYFDCLIQTNETERSELCAMIPNKEENWNYSNNKNPQWKLVE